MKYKIRKEILWRVVSGEVVIVNEDTLENCYLNSTGSDAWEMIDKGLPFDQICKNLAKSYNVTANEIEKDVNDIIDDLINSKILEKVK